MVNSFELKIIKFIKNLSKSIKIVLMVHDIFVPSSYPGIHQKYQEISGFFRKKGCLVLSVPFKGNLKSIFSLRNNQDLKSADYIWLRSPGVRLWLFLIIFRLFHYKKKIVIELPDPLRTYFVRNTYLDNYLNIVSKIELFFSIFIISILNKNSITIIEYSNESKIIHFLFGLNRYGILLGNIVPREAVMSVKYNNVPIEKKCIKFISLANLEKWHGLDRFIEGLGIYLSKNKLIQIQVFIVGSIRKSILEDLHILINKNKLTNNFNFLGVMQPHEISILMETMDIGIGSLGLHRLCHKIASPIKTGVFTGLGLPFIISYNDIRFKKNLPFIFNCPNNDEPVDFHKLIEWYLGLDFKTNQMLMHDYFRKNLSTDSLLDPLWNRM